MHRIFCNCLEYITPASEPKAISMSRENLWRCRWCPALQSTDATRLALSDAPEQSAEPPSRRGAGSLEVLSLHMAMLAPCWDSPCSQRHRWYTNYAHVTCVRPTSAAIDSRMPSAEEFFSAMPFERNKTRRCKPLSPVSVRGCMWSMRLTSAAIGSRMASAEEEAVRAKVIRKGRLLRTDGRF